MRRGSSPIEAVDGSISGAIFFDADMDGVQDYGEPGIAHVAVRCDVLFTDGSVAFTHTITSNALGFYTLSGLDAGRYRVRVESAPSVIAGDVIVEITGDSQNVVGSIGQVPSLPSRLESHSHSVQNID